MSLSEELARVREYAKGKTQPPTNEADTCSWVLYPLLLKCGYKHNDITQQSYNGAGEIPDFKVLPDTEYTWFLEAKKWATEFKETHIIQAINYANGAGKRWVVLSNGCEWRLYDNHLAALPPAERRITSAQLDRPGELEALLEALSKASVQSGGLERFAQQSRLRTVLSQQFVEPNSDVLAAIVVVLKKKHGLTSVTSSDVQSFIQHNYAVSTVPPPPEDGTPLAQTPKNSTSTLRELMQAGDGMKWLNPEMITYPDAEVMEVFTWREVTLSVIKWLGEKGKMPALPFRGQRGGSRYLINTIPIFNSEQDDDYKTLVIKGQNIYVHTHRSATEFVRCLNVLCDEAGESPDGFRVKHRQKTA